uniref:Uncharacterized protein n=1 Tax=Arundo donax TaxID=35708 RepID=A0A0A9HLF8_ARUDO
MGWSRSSQVKSVSWSRSGRAPATAPAGRRRHDGWMIYYCWCVHCELSTVTLWFLSGDQDRDCE